MLFNDATIAGGIASTDMSFRASDIEGGMSSLDIFFMVCIIEAECDIPAAGFAPAGMACGTSPAGVAR